MNNLLPASSSLQRLSPCPICQGTNKKCVLTPPKIDQRTGKPSEARLILCYYRHSEEYAPEGYLYCGSTTGQMSSGKFLYVGGKSHDSLKLDFSKMTAGAARSSFVDQDGNIKPAAGGGGISMRRRTPESFKNVYAIGVLRLYTFDEMQRIGWEKDLYRQISEEETKERVAQQYANVLSVADRNIDYRRIIKRLGFSSIHDEVLTERGLSAAGLDLAKEMGFCSWKPGFRVDPGVSPALAGANHAGTLLRGVAGLGIPCRTPVGEITGFQVRPDSNSYRNKCKYAWISSNSDANGSIPGNGPNLPNGELPHYCWIYPGIKPGEIREVWLVEGGIKSFLSANFLWEQGLVDVAVIGAPGNFFGGDTVKEYLNVFGQSVYVRLMVDAGMTENEQVAQSYFKAIRLIKSWGFDLTIGWWGQLKKQSTLDLDELIIPTGNSIKTSRIQPKTKLLINGQALEVSSVKSVNGGAFNNPGVKVVTFTDGTEQIVSGSVQVVSQLDAINWIDDEAYFELHSPKLKKLIEPFQAVKAGIAQSDFPLPDPWTGMIRDAGRLTNWNGWNDENSYKQIYHPDDRLEVWREFVTGGDDGERRKRYVLDSSPVGSGKSHTAGLLSADALGSDHVTKVIYLTNDPQNPTALTFSKDNGWKILRGRDYGRVIRITKGPDGSESKQIRRVGKDYEPVKDGPLHFPSNCDRAELSEILSERNVPPNAANICNGCTFKTKCNLASGSGFGYLGDRKDVMMSDKIIAHPEAIDLDEIEDDEVVALICEEASTFPWFKSYEVTERDIDRAIRDIAMSGNPRLQFLMFVIDELQRACQDDGGSMAYFYKRYGWDHSKVLDYLRDKILRDRGMTEVPEVTMQELDAASHQDLGILHEADQWEGADRESREALRNVRAIQTSGETLSKNIGERLPLRWLPDFYKVLRGDTDVRLTCSAGGFEIQIINQRLRQIMTHPRVATTIMLDATEEPEFFEKQLGRKVHHVSAEMPTDIGLVDIIQVHGMGMMSSQRSSKQQKDLEAMIDHIRKINGDVNLPVIDLKTYAAEGDGIWHKDSRGSNLYATADALILVGMGIPNVGSMRDEYALLNGYHPSSEETLRAYPIHDINQPLGGPWKIRVMNESKDEGLARYIRQKVLTNYRQAIGRLRAIRRPGAKLTIYAITDYPLEQDVRIVDAKEVLVSRQTINDRIQKAIQERAKRGWQITTRAIANHVKCSAGYVSKSEAWKAYRASISTGSGVIPNVNNIINKRNHSIGASNIDGAGVSGVSGDGGDRVDESPPGKQSRSRSGSSQNPQGSSAPNSKKQNGERGVNRRVSEISYPDSPKFQD